MFYSSNQATRKRTRFTKREDQQLIELIQEHGNSNWKEIASLMTNRNTRQCKDRWDGFLSPNINNTAWTFEEDIFLVEKIKEFGTKWKLLTQFFPNRNDTSLKNRYQKIGKEKPKPQTKEIQHKSNKEHKTSDIFEEFDSAEFSFELEKSNFSFTN
jgi:hypothetical protein